MRKYLFVSVLFLLIMKSSSVFADEESDKFLANVAQSVRGKVAQNGADMTVSAEYGKKAFVLKALMRTSNDTIAQAMDKCMAALVSDDDKLILEALTLERRHKGFIDNMIRSKATLTFSAKDEQTGRLYERSMKPKQIKTINIADTADLLQKQLEIELKAINATTPVYLDNGTTMNRVFIEKSNLILEFLVNERATPIEQIEEQKDLIELLMANSMRSSAFARYVEPCTKAGLDFVFRMKGNWSGKHTDIVMPLSKAKDIFDPNNTIDEVDIVMLTTVYTLRKQLPHKGSNGFTTTAVDYADKTFTYTFEVTGDEAKYLYDFDRINKLDILNLQIENLPEELAQYDIKYRYIYKNPGWEKDIVREVSTKEILRRNSDQNYQDSLSTAQSVELWNLYKSEYKDDIKEVHSFDGKQYTISFLIKNRQISPAKLISVLNRETSSIVKDYPTLTKTLCRMKANFVMHAKNELTGKEEQVTIPYEVLQGLIE